MIQRKQNGLLAAKRCVRSHKYNWSDIRTCVRDVPLLNAPAQNVTQNSGLNLLDMKASLCSSLEAQNVSSVICDLAADEFENTIGSSGISSDFVDIIDSPNMPLDSANTMGNSDSSSYLANRIGSSVLPSNPVLTSGSSDISLDSVNSQPTLEHSDFVHYNNVLNQDSYMHSNIDDDQYY